MAKQVRQHTITDAITALCDAVDAEVDGSLTPEKRKEVVNQATSVIRNSNVMTEAEIRDDGIAQFHQIEELAEAEGIQVENLPVNRAALPPAGNDDNIPF